MFVYSRLIICLIFVTRYLALSSSFSVDYFNISSNFPFNAGCLNISSQVIRLSSSTYRHYVSKSLISFEVFPWNFKGWVRIFFSNSFGDLAVQGARHLIIGWKKNFFQREFRRRWIRDSRCRFCLCTSYCPEFGDSCRAVCRPWKTSCPS